MKKKKVTAPPVQVNPEDPEQIDVCMQSYIRCTLCGDFILHTECPSSRRFEVGASVRIGCLNNPVVLKRSEDYRFYYTRHDNLDKNGVFISHGYNTWDWSYVFPVVPHDTVSVIPDRIQDRISYSQRTVDSLIHQYYHQGIDVDVEYQRGSVWTQEQQYMLIDSIFKGINIGCIVLACRGYGGNYANGCMYEIVDGKQRLTAIIDFFCGKFPYNGKYYHEMNGHDVYRFDEHPITWGELTVHRNEYDRKLILESFIRLNECGTSMERSIIDKAKYLLEKELKDESR